jgi:hypothetical protein
MDNPSNPEFKIVGELSPSPSVYLFPRNYKGLPTNVDEKLVLNNFPLCSWNNDVYANWLGQNRNKLMTSLATSVAMGVSGAMTENPMLMGMGITGVSTEISQVADRAIQPNQTVGNIGGSGALSVGIQDFFFYPTTITKEYAERIDSFFDMYGYKVNTVKQPNITGRPYWNYVKTINSIITGNIASNDIVELQNIFNKGVTIWHSPSNIGDYSLNNH